jgi:L-aspartate oxidase
MEMTQFHPTVFIEMKFAQKLLLTEALRGEGAYIIDEKGRRFLFDYDERGELASRDIVSRAIFLHQQKGHKVFLDVSMFDEEYFKKRFPTIYQKLRDYDINVPYEPIPISPAFHYMMGGIEVDENSKVIGYKNLYAIGEVAWTGVHGANRMASNSLLECIVFAKSCAHDINQQTLDSVYFQSEPWDASRVAASKEKVVVSHLWDEVRSIMWNFVGIVRSDRRLNYAKHRLEQIETEVDEYYSLYLISSDLTELRNLVKTSQIIIQSALSRQESRGLHFNEDHPMQSKIAKNTII